MGANFRFVNGYAALNNALSASLTKGKTLYTSSCMLCHGPQGSGQGPAAMTLSRKPQNFTSKNFWQTPNIEKTIATTVKNGKGPIPAFPNLSQDDVHFIILYFGHTFEPK